MLCMVQCPPSPPLLPSGHAVAVRSRSGGRLNREPGTLLAILVQLIQRKGMVKHDLKLKLPTVHSQAWRKSGSQQQNKP